MRLVDYLDQLRSLPPEKPLEPELKGQRQEQDKRIREDQELISGAVLQAVLEKGDGGPSPKEGDLVYIHYSVMEDDDDVLYSTRAEQGGNNQPLAFQLEKGKRAPRGWEIALREMSKGQRNMLRIKPIYAYAHEECKLRCPPGVPKGTTLSFDMQLVNFYPASSVKTCGEESDIYRRIIKESPSWESPRPPFEVSLLVSAHTPAHDGVMLSGKKFFETPPEKPLHVQLGKGAIPPGVEQALGYMSKGEISAFVIPADMMRAALIEGSSTKVVPQKGCLIPPPPGKGVQQVELKIQLLSMIQVRDMTGTGEVLKRRLKEGKGDFPVDCPIVDSTVQVHYRVRQLKLDGPLLPSSAHASDEEWTYDSRAGGKAPVEFDTGCGDFPEAVEMAIKLMVPGELASVQCMSARFGYTEVTEIPPGIDPKDPNVEWEVELVSFQKEGHWQNISMEARLSIAERAKAKGNQLYKAGRYQHARNKYEALMRQLDSTRDYETQEQVDSIDAYKLVTVSNLALCCTALGDYAQAVTFCDKGLDHDPGSVKLLLRKAKALSLKGDYEEAESVFKATLKQIDAVEGSSAGGAEAEGKRRSETGTSQTGGSERATVVHEMALNKKREKAAEQKQKQTMKNFFGRQ